MLKIRRDTIWNPEKIVDQSLMLDESTAQRLMSR
jgi:hypothetical protein